ncbi:hypothetical protein LguiB_025338 [Lonicera macranthoides]
MAEECTATSSTTPINWWTDVHASSWSTNTTTTNNNTTWNPTNPNSNSSCEEDVSMTSNSFTNNASNQSGLSIDSSRRFANNNNSSTANELIGETASDHHLWNHVLLNVGSNGGLQNGQDVGDNLLNVYSSKNLQAGLMFDPACDYLKKMDNGWEFSSSPCFNNFDKNFNNGFNDAIFENERLSKLSNLVSNWSIAPPEPEINHQFGPHGCNISLSSSTTFDHHQYSQSTVMDVRTNGLHSCYGHDMKVDERRPIEPLIRKSMNGVNGVGYQMGINNSMNVADNGKYYYGLPDMSFGSCLSKPLVDVSASKSLTKNNLNLSDCKKPSSLQTSYPKFQTTSSTCNTVARSGRRGQLIANEGKKKRTDRDNFDTNSKKPKHDTSSSSPTKAHVPKAKLGDKITALQQIVSPFGKTDTASVLWEAIGYIKFLQEQVEQYLNNPYMKNNSIKDPWGGFDIKNRGDEKFDLKSRGLCLVPISRTPQVYRDNNGSDFWTPAYRGCLYR